MGLDYGQLTTLIITVGGWFPYFLLFALEEENEKLVDTHHTLMAIDMSAKYTIAYYDWAKPISDHRADNLWILGDKESNTILC